MKVVDLPTNQLKPAPWNANAMDSATIARLRTSVVRFGFVGNLVVRRLDQAGYEVIGGNHRLQVLKEMDVKQVPCAVVELDDAEARLLAQALNSIEGVDDLGIKAGTGQRGAQVNTSV